MDYYDNDAIYRQSGVVPFRTKDEKIEILLIKNRSGKRWIIPKGIVEPNLSAWDSAEKEAFEEAGILGKINPVAIGTYQYDKWNGTCTVELFLFEIHEVLDEWPESYRERKWVIPDDAVMLVKEAELKSILANIMAHISGG